MKLAPNPNAGMIRLCEHDGCEKRIYFTNISGFCELHLAVHRAINAKTRCKSCRGPVQARAKHQICFECQHPRPAWNPTLIVRRIVRAVADALRISERDIVSRSRASLLVAGRSAVAMILRERGYSCPQIAAAIGLADHSSVLNLLKRYDHYAQTFPVLYRVVEKHRGVTMQQLLAVAA
jgi:hypothetical protein